MVRFALRICSTQLLNDARLTLVADLRRDNREGLAKALSIESSTLSDMPEKPNAPAIAAAWAKHLTGFRRHRRKTAFSYCEV